jgi:leader peptidase (prepilin peptidase)/N-methyltransferase
LSQDKTLPETLAYIVLFVFGACVGSFLNVCIRRIPPGVSVVTPPSECPKCNAPIRFYDNIPIVSYIVLRGRCRACAEGISPLYPAVEAIAAFFTVFLYLKFSFTSGFFVYAVFIYSLVVASFIDLTHRVIPNVISIGGVLAGFLLSGAVNYPLGFLSSFIGAVMGAFILLLISASYYLATGKEGLGLGDVKLLAMIGAFLGWKGAVFTLFSGAFAGAVIGVILIAFFGGKGKSAIPFGPFLSLGAVGFLFFGEAAINWYIKTVWQI